MLGHANISITLDSYSHVIPDLGDAAEAMDDALYQSRSAIVSERELGSVG
jgi:hypothetical protein